MESGYNRSDSGIQNIAASSDIEAVSAWLNEFCDSPRTLRAYQKETDRLLMWAKQICRSPLSGLTREDFQSYETFLATPLPSWCGPARPRNHPEWKPFVKGLSAPSIRHSLLILGSMMNWLVQAGYLATNPLALERRRNRKGKRRPIDRYLDQPTWHAVLDYLESMPDSSSKQLRQKARATWLVQLLYLTAIRRSEAASLSTRDLSKRYDPRTGETEWWLTVTGKGETVDRIPFIPELVTAMRTYRKAYGLEEYPSPDEKTPLVIGPRGQHVSDKTIFRIVHNIFHGAADAIAARDPERAVTLRSASTHWMRHTSATHQLDNDIDLRVVQSVLRHKSIQTTTQYLHTDESHRHHQLRRLKIRSDV
ncbi:tyrosine-type recombinase/integrase [Vogesella sp. XCS3]|uniref:tyrosine-type recombinase/integrase n=1 Tax=Vogesella sp. XCS3 TaxID=2877939 RepID=UPI001D0B5F1F|nr:tyrosine-type recombinase/integrase [Vogesella sp. XCS3]UDM18940.1 tyrosine-type recombinase/integrase [Vogesella sp. XCS3]